MALDILAGKDRPLDPQRLAEAREMYFQYLGSHFGMGHDGVYDLYKAFAVSQEQEAAWRQELIALLTGRLSATDTEAVLHLSTMQAREALPALLAYAGKGDSYVQLIYANALWDIAGAPDAGLAGPSAETVARAQQRAVNIWETTAGGKIHLQPDSLGYRNLGAGAADRLRQWAADRLAHARQQGSA